MLETPLLPELEEGLTAVQEGDAETAQKALSVVETKLGKDHPRFLHLRGSIAWLGGDLDAAQVDLQRAVLASPTDPEICLDSAELALREFHDLDSAERTIGDLLRASGLSPEAKDEANFLMAGSLCMREEPQALERALEHLDAISLENRAEPVCCKRRAEILLDLDRAPEAVAVLDAAIEQEGEDPDLYYLSSIALHENGDHPRALEQAVRAHALDSEAMGPEQEVGDVERQELREDLEEMFEDLPEKLLRRVANAQIEVQARLSTQQVRDGADPRAVVLFEGQCASQSAQSLEDETDAKLEKILIVRDMLYYGLDSDDPEELGDIVFDSLAAEIQRFFGLQDLIAASV